MCVHTIRTYVRDKQGGIQRMGGWMDGWKLTIEYNERILGAHQFSHGPLQYNTTARNTDGHGH